MPKKKKAHCLRCKRKVYARGLCNPCYQAAYNAIRDNKVTEADLIENGLLLPSKGQGRKVSNPTMKGIEQLSEKDIDDLVNSLLATMESLRNHVKERENRK